MNVLVAGVVKQIDTVIIDDYVQDDEGNALSVLAKSIILDNNKSYLAIGNIDVEVGQEVCFYLKEGDEKITKSINKNEADSLEESLAKKDSSDTKKWKHYTLTSLALLLVNIICLNDSHHRYLSSNDPIINIFFYVFCFSICLSTAMSFSYFSKWKKEKKKSCLSSEDKETLKRFKSGFVKQSEAGIVNTKIKDVHHV